MIKSCENCILRLTDLNQICIVSVKMRERGKEERELRRMRIRRLPNQEKGKKLWGNALI